MNRVKQVCRNQQSRGRDQDGTRRGELPPLAMVHCRYGKMVCFVGDSVISRSLQVYGEWAEHELSLLKPYVRPGSTVVDVGSNVGSHSLAFARFVPTGRVVAIEAQPAVCAVLGVNCLLNGCTNVEVIPALCAARSGWTKICPNYSIDPNIGGFNFTRELRGARLWPLSLWSRPRGGSVVQVRRLDDMVYGSEVSLVKIDVEGMEMEVLAGAPRLLRRCQPVFYIEQLDTRELPRLHKQLTDCNYGLFWLETHPFNRQNFRNVRENLWWRTETGILALPRHIPVPEDLPRVDPSAQSIPCVLDARAGWSGRT